MTSLELLANAVRLLGLLMVAPGLWFTAGGMRVVVSGRIDERKRSGASLKRGLPLLVVGLLLLFGGSWLANWGANVMADFVAVAKTSEVSDPGQTLVEVGERLVVLIHAAGHWYALDDVCTHDGGPLSEGPLDPAAGTIACPRHGAKFDIKTGAAVSMPATKPTKAHEVKVDGDRVLVRLTDG